MRTSSHVAGFGAARSAGRTRMILLPAIDILDGKAVRLARETSRADRLRHGPARRRATLGEAGARALHVVDLDGARSGAPVNLEHVRRIAREAGVPVQTGGGLDVEAVHDAIAAGATRVVLGTAAYRDVDLLDEAVAALGIGSWYPSTPATGGSPPRGGSSRPSCRSIGDRAVERARRAPVRVLEHRARRDAGRPRSRRTRPGAVVRGNFVYSGGSRRSKTSARGCADAVNLAGVIVGKALYEQRFGVAEAQRALDTAGR